MRKNDNTKANKYLDQEIITNIADGMYQVTKYKPLLRFKVRSNPILVDVFWFLTLALIMKSLLGATSILVCPNSKASLLFRLL